MLTLFHRNPGMKGTAAELAEAIGWDPEAVEEQARKLAQLRILEEVNEDGGSTYRYLPPRSIVGVKGLKGIEAMEYN